jgi:hypothetical protein
MTTTLSFFRIGLASFDIVAISFQPSAVSNPQLKAEG